ncbi:DUF2852 domain-containing protein [Algicella marina]|uniref:DUF2852 domain-containing protein n=1 Tax=Algicella marina TaxID=2683284 RepID=A0A6P1SWA5_9RHOB|nr:DUF2852 domain-containing protein [Algicella marina]QHQ34954.1 DUF2852 domain-containing protein [Algicella marina]
MSSISHWLRQAEAWLDARGRGAWIAAMILGFIFVWPVGLALLFYMLWSNRMSCSHARKRNFANGFRFNGSSGNTAFDSYRDATLKRLEEEQSAFQGFLDRLRQAKDQAEFDQFMNDRRRKADRDEDTDGNFGNEVPA